MERLAAAEYHYFIPFSWLSESIRKPPVTAISAPMNLARIRRDIKRGEDQVLDLLNTFPVWV